MEEAALYRRFHERLNYDPDTGALTWKIDHGRRCRAGKPAGHVCKHSGYAYVVIDRKQFQAHRIAWVMVTGLWPERYIDHKNGEKADNRFVNLREATHSQNMANRRIGSNNKVGLKGIHYSPRHHGYRAQIKHHGRVRHIGYFKDALQAHAAYVREAERLHGEFARAA